MPTLTAPRRDTRTYVMDGRERYADTGRPVDEQFGGHVVLRIVEDPEAFAAAVEAEGDAEPAKWPRSSRYIGEHRREQAYESARQIRQRGAYRSVYDDYRAAADAEQSLASLRHHHGLPGVRWELAVVERMDTCPTEHCHCPRFLADGTWWHNTGNYPAECAPPPPPPAPEPEPDDFVIDIGVGTMRCGWCQLTEAWPHAGLGYARLTGFHLLGVHRETNTLVVLAEATNLAGETVHLPHHCLNIPAEQHARYAPETVLARA